MRIDDLDGKLRAFETALDPCVLPGVFLVARLDGSPATLTGKSFDARDTRWQRFRIGLRRLFVGPLNDSRTEAPKSASAQ
jgi:hypothetical protein